MTTRQRIALQTDWWPAACRAQGWNASDRALRLRVCAWAVCLTQPTQLELLEAIRSGRAPARQLASTNELDSTDDVDAVRYGLALLADGVVQKRGPRERLLYKIRRAARPAYTLALLRSARFQKTSLNDLEAMPEEELRQMLVTLTARNS
jgi:hypothetical protein